MKAEATLCFEGLWAEGTIAHKRHAQKQVGVGKRKSDQSMITSTWCILAVLCRAGIEDLCVVFDRSCWKCKVSCEWFVEVKLKVGAGANERCTDQAVQSAASMFLTCQKSTWDSIWGKIVAWLQTKMLTHRYLSKMEVMWHDHIPHNQHQAASTLEMAYSICLNSHYCWPALLVDHIPCPICPNSCQTFWPALLVNHIPCLTLQSTPSYINSRNGLSNLS